MSKLARDDQIGVDVAGVQQVLAWRQALRDSGLDKICDLKRRAEEPVARN
jgi:hypothetical protein